MTAKPKKKTKSKARTKVTKSKDSNIGAKKAKKKGALGDDPLQWMKDALDESEGQQSASSSQMPSVYEAEVDEAVAKDIAATSALESPSDEIEMPEEQSAVEDQTGRASVGDQNGEVEEEVQSESEKTSSDGTIDLGSRLIISTVKEVKLALDQALEMDGNVLLEASRLEDVDTAGVQMLFAFKLELARQKRALDFSTIPGKLKDVAEIMSVSESLFDTR